MPVFEGGKLYDGGRAPNPRRVQVFLKEKGVEIERVQVSINDLEQKSENFSKINPMKKLPVLEMNDGTIISETVAICRYFEEVYPDPPLMGRDALEKATIEMWQRRMELEFLLPVAFSFRHLHPGAKVIEPIQVNEWGEMNQGRAMQFMTFLDNELQSRPYVAGDAYTIADITGLVTCQFLKPARLSIPDELSALKEWFELIAARPAAAFD